MSTVRWVTIIPWCIGCHNCEKICPLAFAVQWQSKVITDQFDGIEDQLLEAAAMCPVQVIKVDHDGPGAAATMIDLVDKTMLTADVAQLTFRTHVPFSFVPWQYVNLVMHDKQWEFSRAYSIASGTVDTCILTVKYNPWGRGTAVIQQARVWDHQQRWYIWPTWVFGLSWQRGRKLMIATGTWLAPLYAMIQHSDPSDQITLLIGARTLSDHYYLDQLSQYPHVRVKAIVSRGDEQYQGLRWRVTDYLSDAREYDEFYLCGNPEMVHDVSQILTTQGISPSVIHEELYSAAPVITAPVHTSSVSWVTLVNWWLIWSSIWLVIAYIAWGQYGLLRDIARWTAVATMAIRPLADITWRSRLRRSVALRQWLGIASSIIVVTAWIYTIITSGPWYWSEYIMVSNWSLSGYKLFARASEITALILLITSNRWSQMTLGVRWKRVHKLAYVYFFAAGIYIWSLGKVAALWSMVAVLWLVIVAILMNRTTKK